MGTYAAIARDPYREELHVHLISALLEQGNRSDAVIEIREHEQILHKDLRRFPSPR